MIIFLVLFLSTIDLCNAEMSTPNYKITSDVIGSFGSKESSTSFELGDTGGEVGTGDSGSTSYNLAAGFWSIVGDDDILIFNITDAIAELETLSDSQVKYDTASFNAASTAQGGYVIQYFGGSLDSGAHAITPLPTPSLSDPGNEQFGFNLQANDIPAIGNIPVGGYGKANSDYYEKDKFKFSSGDTLAYASRPSGQTNYVASFIGNIDNLSSAGNYTTSITVIATGRY
ncbi:MAG: hypothetical protein V1804_00070 [Patescibacteria group bacterium]